MATEWPRGGGVGQIGSMRVACRSQPLTLPAVQQKIIHYCITFISCYCYAAAAAVRCNRPPTRANVCSSNNAPNVRELN